MLGASMQEGEGGYIFWNKGGSFSAWVNGWLVEDCGAVIGEANVCMIFAHFQSVTLSVLGHKESYTDA